MSNIFDKINPGNIFDQKGRFGVHNTLFFFCDIQEKLRGKVQSFDRIAQISSLYIQAAQILKIPYHIAIINTERVGDLIPEIKEHLSPEDLENVYEKPAPTMVDKVGKQFLSKYPERKKILLLGCETHVCIRQTAQDLISYGYEVFLLLDCIDSLREVDHQIGLMQCAKLGVNFFTFDAFCLEASAENAQYIPTNVIASVGHLQLQMRYYYQEQQQEKNNNSQKVNSVLPIQPKL